MTRLLLLLAAMIVASPAAHALSVPAAGLTPTLVPYGQYRNKPLSLVPPNELLAMSNRRVAARKVGGDWQLAMQDTAVEGLGEVLNGEEAFRQGAGETSPCSAGGWWGELSELAGGGEVDTACKKVYEQIGAFCSGLSRDSWWAIWRHHKHRDIVQTARQMIEENRLCRACGLPLLPSNNNDNNNANAGGGAHASSNNEHPQGHGQPLSPALLHHECLTMLCLDLGAPGLSEVAVAA